MTFKIIKRNLIYSGYSVVLISRFRGYGKDSVKGFIAPDTLQIFINKSLDLEERVRTLIHELLHDHYPKWDEKLIENKTQEIYRNLNKEEKGFLQFFVSEDELILEKELIS